MMTIINGEPHLPIDLALHIMEQYIWQTKGVRVNINRPDTPERIKLFDRLLNGDIDDSLQTS